MAERWFYLSFADPGTPKGRFLGGIIIEGADIDDAIQRCWQLGAVGYTSRP